MSHNGSSESSSYVDENWASWFCNLSGNQYFCEVEKSYMEDSFNLFGLKQYLPKDYSKALDSILDRLNPNEPETEDLSRSAVLLYGLIHARYIITSHGLEAMHRKYLNKDFGECPRMLCRGQPVVPMGFTDDPKHGMVKLFCPKCRDVYNCHSNQRHIDGAFFGPTFPNLFFMTYENLVPGPAMEQFVPRVFGFRIHPCSNSLSNRTPSTDFTAGAGAALSRGVALSGVNASTSSGGGTLLIASTGHTMPSTVAAESSSSTLAIQNVGGSSSVSHVIRGEPEIATGKSKSSSNPNASHSGESNHNSISEETLATTDLKGYTEKTMGVKESVIVAKKSLEMEEEKGPSGERSRRDGNDRGIQVANDDNGTTVIAPSMTSRQSKRHSEEVKDTEPVATGREERMNKRGRR